MELEHSFTVPVPEDRAWDVLLDVERVAPCMPGATVQSVEGDEINGSIKVKVGPITMTYQGTAHFTERDPAAHVITLEAAGKETRGAGTASAKVRSMLEGKGDETHVVVHTTLNVTGRPAQFGRGVMAEVGGKLIGIFADNLAAMLAASEPEAAPGDGAVDEALPIDVLNLSTRAWSSLRKDGVQTLGDLTRRTEQQLLAIDGVGPASLADIRGKLADRGLSLAQAPAQEPAIGRHAADREELADVTPLRPARHEAAEPAAAPQPAGDFESADWQPPDNEAIDLLGVAGLPVLKRAAPAAAALLAILLVVFGLRRRRRARRG
ncbi:MAG TPA: SRPBCC domain-containing protein [Streptosporangiaceae bacterium]|nr:SRPBCC domain-containing protein [Streptosporangiaceae bacterium]